MTSQQVFIFLVTLPSTFCYKLQAYSLLHKQFLLQIRTCNRPSLPQKGYKIHLSCHFSLKTHYSSTLQQILWAVTSLQDSYLRTTSNISLRLTQSPNIKILFKRASSPSVQTVLSAAEKGLHQYDIGLICLPNNYEKDPKFFKFLEASTKSVQLLPPCFTRLAHQQKRRHILNASKNCLPI